MQEKVYKEMSRAVDLVRKKALLERDDRKDVMGWQNTQRTMFALSIISIPMILRVPAASLRPPRPTNLSFTLITKKDFTIPEILSIGISKAGRLS